MPDFAYVSRMQLNWSFHVLGLRREIWPSLEEKSDVGLRAGLEFGDKSLCSFLCTQSSQPHAEPRGQSSAAHWCRWSPDRAIPTIFLLTQKEDAAAVSHPPLRTAPKQHCFVWQSAARKRKGIFFPLYPVGFCFCFFSFSFSVLSLTCQISFCLFLFVKLFRPKKRNVPVLRSGGWAFV